MQLANQASQLSLALAANLALAQIIWYRMTTNSVSPSSPKTKMKMAKIQIQKLKVKVSLSSLVGKFVCSQKFTEKHTKKTINTDNNNKTT